MGLLEMLKGSGAFGVQQAQQCLLGVGWGFWWWVVFRCEVVIRLFCGDGGGGDHLVSVID